MADLKVVAQNSKADTIEVEIERIVPGGVGLAHAEGRTIFVSLAAPGDVLRVRLGRTRGKVAFASIVEILRPSPSRVEPPCPYFGRCGGCDFQQLSYETQLATKVDIIRDCLHRIARIDPIPHIEIHPSPQQWHYRARANWQFDPRTQAFGYFERSSHRVCDVAECGVLVPELESTLEKLRAGIKSGSLEIPAVDIDAVAGDESVSVNPEFGTFSAREVTRKIGAENYYFDANAFFQTNHELLDSLVREAIRDAQGETAIDLYCGVGLFTLPLARRFNQVTGVESNRPSAEFARRNLENAKLTNARVVAARVDDWLRGANASSVKGPNHSTHTTQGLDFLLLDPPRTGAEPAVIEGILSLKPKHISYVSCDPATLARDLKPLLAAGYSLDSIAAFDMFPQTHHVETVVHLRT
ncbi:MAG TPA: class I SAM-dependent RNA methyltransferase [Pyrinomonadaceae bacterium]|nr:class I SAM-dependent RNA methyltransferase [Pyrinomonadaceae bacterium]